VWSPPPAPPRAVRAVPAWYTLTIQFLVSEVHLYSILCGRAHTHDSVFYERGTPVAQHPVWSPPPAPPRAVRAPPARRRGTSRIRNSPPPQGHHRVIGVFLLWGPRVALFHMSEVHLYSRFILSSCRLLDHLVVSGPVKESISNA
jgi:hypothetical protein